MVKKLLLVLVLALSVFAQEVIEEELLDEKIISFIGEESYSKNRDYIHIIFRDTKNFYTKEHINVVKVVETLQENGLLHLFFEEPQQYEMTFHSTGSPLFFVKLMGDTLRSMGYYRYVTKESKNDESGFEWTISLEAEYVTDPVLLRKELSTCGCDIIDIVRNSATDWHYDIDTSKAHLKVDQLEIGKKKKYSRLQYAKWLDVDHIKSMQIKSHRANFWYPYIALYDSSLRLLKVIKQDEETSEFNLNLPQETRYIRVSDLYTITNIRYGLEFSPSGKK
ncbi:hypothetical protein [Sulfurimonas sp. HSL3-7]|uniref:hypothetical protein n=1 Tax=Sulfonitrofixus jiaomeiensis TaxID=3131938 RepID=UPI0031F77402